MLSLLKSSGEFQDQCGGRRGGPRPAIAMFLRYYYTQALLQALSAGLCLSPLLRSDLPRLYLFKHLAQGHMARTYKMEIPATFNFSGPVSCSTVQATLLSHSSFIGEASGLEISPTGREEGEKMSSGGFSHFYLF